MIEITRAMTEPIQMGYHPINVKNTVMNKDVKDTVTSGFFPRVAINTTTNSPIVNARENMIPASVAVVSRAEATLDSQSDHITMMIRLSKRGGYI